MATLQGTEMRTLPLLAAFLLLACGDAPPPPVMRAPSGAITAPAVSATPVSEPSATPAAPLGPLAGSVDRCEAVAGGCGGWIGCARVRETNIPEHFIDPDSGDAYVRGARGAGEVCSGPGEDTCRPAMVPGTHMGVLCVNWLSTSPVAPFSCSMRDGACIQGPDPRSEPGT